MGKREVGAGPSRGTGGRDSPTRPVLGAARWAGLRTARQHRPAPLEVLLGFSRVTTPRHLSRGCALGTRGGPSAPCTGTPTAAQPLGVHTCVAACARGGDLAADAPVRVQAHSPPGRTARSGCRGPGHRGEVSREIHLKNDLLRLKLPLRRTNHFKVNISYIHSVRPSTCFQTRVLRSRGRPAPL